MKQVAINDPYLVQRKDQPNKDGTRTILLRINLYGKKRDISMNVACPEGFFDPVKGKIKKNYPNSDKLNVLLDKQLNKARAIVLNARINDVQLNVDEFIKQFNGIQRNNKSFIEFIRSEIELEKKRSNKASATIVKYGFQLNKLERYNSNLLFSDLTENFLANYEQYMRDELKNKRSSSNNSLKFIRKFLYLAIAKKLTDHNPFKNYGLKEERIPQIRHLTEEEFNKIKTYFSEINANHKHYRTLKSFIFSCYTGLRYGDAKKLTLNDTLDDVISIKMEKTDRYVKIPLLNEAKKLLNYSLDPTLPNLNTPSDQDYNRKLKVIAKELGIKTHLTTHVARHSCASFLINAGVPVTTVQMILGHTEVKQSLHYARVKMETIKGDLKKVEGKF